MLSQATICSLWDSLQRCCSAWCLVSRPAFLASSQDTTAYQKCTLVEQMLNPIGPYPPVFSSWIHYLLQFFFNFLLSQKGRWNRGHRVVVWSTWVNKLPDRGKEATEHVAGRVQLPSLLFCVISFRSAVKYFRLYQQI